MSVVGCRNSMKGVRHSIAKVARAGRDFYQTDDVTRCKKYVYKYFLSSSFNMGILKFGMRNHFEYCPTFTMFIRNRWWCLPIASSQS